MSVKVPPRSTQMEMFRSSDGDFMWLEEMFSRLRRKLALQSMVNKCVEVDGTKVIEKWDCSRHHARS